MRCRRRVKERLSGKAHGTVPSAVKQGTKNKKEGLKVAEKAFKDFFKLKRGYTPGLFGGNSTAYYVIKIPEDIIVAAVYPWDVFYPRKIYKTFLKEFNKTGDINYVVVLTSLAKCFEAETLKEAKKWLEENWDNEKFNFTNKLGLLPVLYIPEIKLKMKLTKTRKT